MNDEELTLIEIDQILNDIVYGTDKHTCDYVGIACHECTHPDCKIRSEPPSFEEFFTRCDIEGHHQWVSEGYHDICLECGAVYDKVLNKYDHE